MKKLPFIFCCLIFCCFTSERKASVNTGNTNFILSKNILGEPDSVILSGKSIIVLLKEPSCTRCKEDLSEYINNISDFKTHIILPLNQGNTFSKKMYEKTIKKQFTCMPHISYSSDSSKLSFSINYTEYSFEVNNSPEICIVKTPGKFREKDFTHLPYKELFEDTVLDTTYLFGKIYR